MNMIDWFMPLLSNLITQLAPVAFVIWGVSFAFDFITKVATGGNRRLQ